MFSKVKKLSAKVKEPLRKEKKMSEEAGDSKKRKKHDGETAEGKAERKKQKKEKKENAEEKAERKKQKKTQLGSWRCSNRGNRSLEFVSDLVIGR
ncbi:hypothetical protein N0V85_004697 [Neurospora sp. IMI 360204]|nr:hypothetical protein N0V85_004697 [Neurospora sp. IMI 360204]